MEDAPTSRSRILRSASCRDNGSNYISDVKPSTKRAQSIIRTKQAVPIVVDIKPVEKERELIESVEQLEVVFKQQMCLKTRANNFFCKSVKDKRLPTSKKTLADLGKHQLTPEQATSLAGRLPESVCTAAIAARSAFLRDSVLPEVFIDLSHRYNVLLHGFGSKRVLLNSFVNCYLATGALGDTVVVPGYLDSLDASRILSSVIEFLTRGTPRPATATSPNALATTIVRWLEQHVDRQLCFVIHNIDGPAIRQSLDAVVILARSPSIRIIATIDHIYADRLLSRHGLMYWVWHECSTGLPYCEETLKSRARLMADRGTTGLASLRAVIGSLHDNARQMFLLLARHHLSNCSDNGSRISSDEGMSLETLLDECRARMLVTSEAGLRSLLREFLDHHIVLLFLSGQDRSERARITLDSNSLRQYVAEISDAS